MTKYVAYHLYIHPTDGRETAALAATLRKAVAELDDFQPSETGAVTERMARAREVARAINKIWPDQVRTEVVSVDRAVLATR